MTPMVDEFIKISEDRTKRLLEVDPQSLDSRNPQHQQLLEQKALALDRIHHGPATAQEKVYARRLTAQTLMEGAKATTLIGLGTGLGFGLRGMIAGNPKAKQFLRSYPALATGLGAGLIGGAVLASMSKRREQERRLRHARTVLR